MARFAHDCNIECQRLCNELEVELGMYLPGPPFHQHDDDTHIWDLGHLQVPILAIWPCALGCILVGAHANPQPSLYSISSLLARLLPGPVTAGVLRVCSLRVLNLCLRIQCSCLTLFWHHTGRENQISGKTSPTACGRKLAMSRILIFRILASGSSLAIRSIQRAG